MRDKFNQFMQGRYGNDDLNRFLMKIILAAFVLSLFTGRIVFGGVVSLSRIFYWIALALLVYRTGLEVIMWDERLTTVEANRTLMEASVRRENRKQYLDQLAAVFILQGYLDSLHC